MEAVEEGVGGTVVASNAKPSREDNTKFVPNYTPPTHFELQLYL